MTEKIRKFLKPACGRSGAMHGSYKVHKTNEEELLTTSNSFVCFEHFYLQTFETLSANFKTLVNN